MALFDFFKKNTTTTTTTTTPPQPTYTPPASNGNLELDLSKGISLNLQKGMTLDLSKAPSTLQDIRVAAGWDVATIGRAYDLDLCAILLDHNGHRIDTVYFNHKRSNGIQLDHDNLTGAGDGDDENIFMNFHKINPNVAKVVICVVIYDAHNRGQKFKNVRNAYVRLVDQSKRPEYEICRFKLTEDGGDATAVKFAEFTRTTSGWDYTTLGEYLKGSISTIERQYR